MGKKQISTRIPDSSVWDSFLEYVEQKHGKTHGVLGLELQNVLIQSIKYPIEDIKLLEIDNKRLKEIEEKHYQLNQDYRKLRNKYNHLQERFIKSQKDLNVLERETRKLHVVIAKIEKLSFWERVLNRLPSEMKQLTTNEEDMSSESNR